MTSDEGESRELKAAKKAQGPIATMQRRTHKKKVRKLKRVIREAKAKLPQEEDEAYTWSMLNDLILTYGEAAIAESWKGGGDPADVEVLELRLKLATAELCSHMEKMRREFT